MLFTVFLATAAWQSTQAFCTATPFTFVARESAPLQASTAAPPRSSSVFRFQDDRREQRPSFRRQLQRKLGLPFVVDDRRMSVDEAAYQRRKDEWAQKYTSVDALRETFGANRNQFWGDLDAPTARRLYKTLLPKALLELYNLGVHPEDLAPLAYRARVAAKLYARERCSLPARVAANLYDGFRQWRRYGSFDTGGMSYQQVWEKYSTMILEECQGEEGLTEEDVAAKICLKILERSCKTNEMIDKLVLSKHSVEDQRDLEHFTSTLEKDVRKLLQPVQDFQELSVGEQQRLSAKRIRTLKKLIRIKRRLEGRHKESEAKQHVKPAETEREEATSKLPWQNRSRPSRSPKWNERHHRRD